MLEKKTCFLACPIGGNDSPERKRSDGLLRYILKPVLDELNYELIRADQIQSAGKITSQVLQKLNDADIVIADLTGENPNVMYELGIRHATRKPFIHMMESGNKIPFDVYDIRTIFYRLELEAVDSAKSELKAQIESIELGDWTVNSPINFVLSETSGEDVDQVMLTNLHQINNRMAVDLLEMKESIEIVKNIVYVLYNNKEQEREDKNSAMLMEIFSQLMGTAMQNPETFRTLIELGTKEQQPEETSKKSNSKNRRPTS